MPDKQHTKYLLTEDEMPRAWYNIVPDLPKPPAPVLHPGTKHPVTPDDLAPLFPMPPITTQFRAAPYLAPPKPDQRGRRPNENRHEDTGQAGSPDHEVRKSCDQRRRQNKIAAGQRAKPSAAPQHRQGAGSSVTGGKSPQSGRNPFYTPHNR